MNHALFRTHPPQLAVAGQLTPKTPHVSDDLFETSSLDKRAKGLNPCYAKLIGPPDGEGEPMPG